MLTAICTYPHRRGILQGHGCEVGRWRSSAVNENAISAYRTSCWDNELASRLFIAIHNDPRYLHYSQPLRVTATLFNHNLLPNREIILPSLPLLCGDPEPHLPNGIMNASRLVETDAQKACSSVIWRQYRRWKASLPLIRPFCGP